MSKLCAQEDVGGPVNGHWKSGGRAFFFFSQPAGLMMREIMSSYMASVRICSCFQGLNILKRLCVCVQKVLQVQPGRHGWACASDELPTLPE